MDGDENQVNYFTNQIAITKGILYSEINSSLWGEPQQTTVSWCMNQFFVCMPILWYFCEVDAVTLSQRVYGSTIFKTWCPFTGNMHAGRCCCLPMFHENVFFYGLRIFGVPQLCKQCINTFNNTWRAYRRSTCIGIQGKGISSCELYEW